MALIEQVQRFVEMVTVLLYQRFYVSFELVKILRFIDKCQAFAIPLDTFLSTFCRKVLYMF